jgi:Phosphotransferase enzyme family
VRELIEALHPDGVASGSELVIGLAGAAALAPDGIAWIAVRPGRRTLARARARRHGLHVSGSWLALPSADPRVLLPLSSTTSATRRRVAAQLAVARLVHAVLGWKTRIIEELAPGVGLVAQRPGARPLLAWLADIGVKGAVGVAAGWHDPSRVVLVGETTVVKSGKGPGGLEREAELLDVLGPSVDRSGARAPSVVYHGPAGSRVALVESALPGERVSTILRREPARLPTILTQVTDWLSGWHVETRVMRPFTSEDLERLIVTPLRAVAPHLHDNVAYAERVETLGRSLLDRVVPFAAAHNDLTTWNLLLDEDALSVVDWEAADAQSLPLVDLEYLLVDAVAAARRLERDVAFRSADRSGYAEAVAQLGIAPDIAALARYACWLGHAQNELGRTEPGSPRPFLAIVESLAAP